MAKSRLQSALARERGVDFKKLNEKKKAKLAQKLKQKAGKGKAGAKAKEQPVDDDDEEEEWEDEDDEEEDEDEDQVGGGLLDLVAEEGDSDEEDEDDDEDGLDFSGMGDLGDESSDESEVEFEEKIERPKRPSQPATSKPSKAEKAKKKEKVPKPTKGLKDAEEDDEEEDDEEEEEEDDEESDIALSDLEDLPEEEREDIVVHQKLQINNKAALLASLNRIEISKASSVPFSTHMTVASSKPTAEAITDIHDDLNRELAFYAQALEAVKIGRKHLIKEGVPFSRPNDYFAEMVKDDGHMEKVKAKLVEEASAKKAAAEARKLRDLKKFGKQVQVAKQQERAKEKRETLDKIKQLKKKRQENGSANLGTTEADLFDVAVENELGSGKAANSRKRTFSGEQSDRQPANAKRQKKDAKYGFGGKKRHGKSGDAFSSGDLSGFSAKRMKAGPGAGGAGRGGKGGKAPRPGKTRRQAMASKR